MVKQHLFKLSPDKAHTVAVSGSIHGGRSSSAVEAQWLQQLQQQIQLIDPHDLSVPAFFQHRIGEGVAVSRCIPDPSGARNSFLFHQLIFDEEDDLRMLRRLRPISAKSFFALTAEGSLSPDSLNAASGDHALELRSCFHTLQFYFAGKEQILAALIGALTFCARDRRQSVRVLLNESPDQVSQVGHDLMELLLRVLRTDDAARVTYATLQTFSAGSIHYTVTFSPRTSRKQVFPEGDIILDLTGGNLTLPQGVFLPNAEQNARLAIALLAQDVSRMDAISGSTDTAPIFPHALPLKLPSFKEGMSLEQYFSDWQCTMMLRRSGLNEEAFRRFMLGEWHKFISSIISAAECMPTEEFLSSMHSLITQARSYMPQGMEPNEEILADLRTLLLDGVNWDALDLSHPPSIHLMQRVCAHAMELTGDEHNTADYTLSCRVIHHMLHAPIEMDDALSELRQLQHWQPRRFKQLQQCLLRCMEKRLNSDFDIIDEHFVAAAILGMVQFNEGIPDLRRLSTLTTRIESLQSTKAARRFDQIADRMRSHLHMSDSFTFHRGEMRRILLYCCLLGAVIAGITIWYWFF